MGAAQAEEHILTCSILYLIYIQSNRYIIVLNRKQNWINKQACEWTYIMKCESMPSPIILCTANTDYALGQNYFRVRRMFHCFKKPLYNLVIFFSWDFLLFVTVSLDCGQYSMAVTCLIQCFPPWLRFAQCLRCFWDTGHTLHLLNAGKYFTVFLMVTFAGLYNMARGTRPNN